MRVRSLPTVLLAVLLAVILGVFALPAGAQEDDGEVVVRVALHADENNFNPFVEPQAQPLTHDLTMLVYDTLFWSQSQLDPEPWLATEAQPSADFRSWTISLRSGVLWHDGEPFTADDVAFSFQYFSDMDDNGRYGRHINDHPVFESATVIDETTVQLDFAEPIATFRLQPGGDVPILPEHLWSGITDPGADVTSLPVGTGPFKMVDYQPDGSYRLEANEDFFLGAPVIDTLELSVIPDRADAFEALEKGEIDLVARNIPPELNDEIGADEDLEIVGANRNQTVYLSFNLDIPGLNDRDVRKAISLALDSDLMLDTVEGGNGRLATDTWTNPNSPWTRDPEGAHLTDFLAAEQLLDGAGYLPDGDTRSGPDGPLSYTLGVRSSDPNQVRAAELVAEQLEPLGVAVSIQTFDSTALTAASGAGGAPAFDMIIDELETNAQDNPDHLFFLFHSSSDGASGGALFGNYANPTFDAAVEQALGQTEGARRPITHEAQDILAEDIPVVVLYYPAVRAAYRPAAYDGWWSDSGHGVFNKRAFLPGYADDGGPVDDSESALTPISLPGGDGGGGWRIFAGATALAAGAVGFGFWRRNSMNNAAAE